MDLADASRRHLLWLELNGRSAATLRLYRHYERVFVQYLAEQHLSRDLDALNAPNVHAAVEWLQRRSTSGTRQGQGSARAFVGTLKALANFLVQEGVIVASPIASVKGPREPVEEVWRRSQARLRKHVLRLIGELEPEHRRSVLDELLGGVA